MNIDTKPYIYTLRDIAEIIIEQTKNKDYYDYTVDDLRRTINNVFDDKQFKRTKIKNKYYYSEEFKNYCINNKYVTTTYRRKKESLFEYLYKKDILTYEQTQFIPQSIINDFLNRITEYKYKDIITSRKIQGILRRHKTSLHPIKVLVDPLMEFTYTPKHYYYKTKAPYLHKRQTILYYKLQDVPKIINMITKDLKLNEAEINKSIKSIQHYYDERNLI
jgi:hypothetical protein